MQASPHQGTRSRTISRPLARVWQNFYTDEQRRRLDPDFIPNDGRRNADTHYREVALFARMYHSGRHLDAKYTGIVSPKFGEKTRRRGAEFIRLIEENPGYDVYFINPFPENAYFCFNVWSHAELCHPGLTKLAQKLFRAAGVDFDLTRMGRNSPATALYCNFWAGNERFWDGFMDLNLRLLNALENMKPSERKPYFEIDSTYYEPVPFATFIFERLFSTILLMQPNIRALAWPYRGADLLVASGGSVEKFAILASFRALVDQFDKRMGDISDERLLFNAFEQLLMNEMVPRPLAML